MPLIENPDSGKKNHTVEIKIAHLFIFLALFSALVGVLYNQADILYQTARHESAAELETLKQEKAALESQITDLLKKLLRLNELYSASVKKTTLRVENIETVQRETAQKVYEYKSMSEYLLDQNRQLEEKLQACQKAGMSSSSISTDANDSNIQHEKIR